MAYERVDELLPQLQKVLNLVDDHVANLRELVPHQAVFEDVDRPTHRGIETDGNVAIDARHDAAREAVNRCRSDVDVDETGHTARKLTNDVVGETEDRDLVRTQSVVIDEALDAVYKCVCLSGARTSNDDQLGLGGRVDHASLLISQGLAGVYAVHRYSNSRNASWAP